MRTSLGGVGGLLCVAIKRRNPNFRINKIKTFRYSNELISHHLHGQSNICIKMVYEKIENTFSSHNEIILYFHKTRDIIANVSSRHVPYLIGDVEFIQYKCSISFSKAIIGTLLEYMR